MTDIYPLTIVKDRYNGTYSGGKWLAFNENPYMIRQEPFSDDVTCMMFWDEERKIGVGRTKDGAVSDLKEKMQVPEWRVAKKNTSANPCYVITDGEYEIMKRNNPFERYFRKGRAVAICNALNELD